MLKPSSPRTAPKQPRGHQRVDLILDTAASIFAERGYEAATTNAIAEQAGISIGSLYRYFPDKEAILQAWAYRYTERVRTHFEQAFRNAGPEVPLATLLDRLIDPYVALYRDCPVYTQILLGADVSADMAAADMALGHDMIGQTAAMLRRRAPHLSEARARLVATICKVTLKGLISLVANADDKKFQAQVRAEIKQMLLAYLGPILSEEAAPVRRRQ